MLHILPVDIKRARVCECVCDGCVWCVWCMSVWYVFVVCDGCGCMRVYMRGCASYVPLFFMVTFQVCQQRYDCVRLNAWTPMSNGIMQMMLIAWKEGSCFRCCCCRRSFFRQGRKLFHRRCSRGLTKVPEQEPDNRKYQYTSIS